MLKQHGPERGPGFALAPGISPTGLEWAGGNRPAMVRLNDGRAEPSACIRCPDAPCLRYAPAELTVAGAPSFPADLDERVCPTGAITWPRDVPVPHVDPSHCIGCGLCVARCPVGAIHVNEETKAVVSPGPTSILAQIPSRNAATHARLAERFQALPRSGILAGLTERQLRNVYAAIGAVMPGLDAQFPNHLVRNLAIATRVTCAMRRRGDVNVRMDVLIGFSAEAVAVGEVEFDANAMLDTPRNILDDVAVMASRYHVARNKLRAAIIGLNVPNQRSEYWQIIEDIDAVLGVKINTVTVGALILLVWARANLMRLEQDAFFTGKTRSLRAGLLTALGKKVDLPEGLLGILESQK